MTPRGHDEDVFDQTAVDAAKNILERGCPDAPLVGNEADSRRYVLADPAGQSLPVGTVSARRLTGWMGSDTFCPVNSLPNVSVVTGNSRWKRLTNGSGPEKMQNNRTRIRCNGE